MSTGNSLAMMPWFVRDYLASTRAMRLAERGAYCDLLFYEWEMGELPNDVVTLSRLVGSHVNEFKQVWKVIASKFVTGPKGGLINPRLEEHRVKAIQQRESKVKGAEITNAKRNGERNGHIVLNGSHSETLSGTPPSPSPSPREEYPPQPLPREGHSRPRRSSREDRDQSKQEATRAWNLLVGSGGSEGRTDPRVQRGIAAAGGWPRIRMREEGVDDAKCRGAFVAAYLEASP